ncbi:MAG: PD40 domain-containing protein [Verrucomicrobia bacterium]|nr:PD40 domain-containing protein [Verrucomicrobiota bacterium]
MKTRTGNCNTDSWPAVLRVWRGVWRVLIVAILLAHCETLASVQPVSLRDSSLAPPAGGNGDSMVPILSADGRYVLFASTANNLLLATKNSPIPPSFPARLNVFLRDRTNDTTRLVSVNLTGVAGGNGDSLPAAISTNGQFALFESRASDLVPGDTNNATDVFLRDLVNETTTLISASTNGGFGNGACRGSVMTPDGRYVAFVSAANNLVEDDTNNIPDVFVRNLQTGVTTLVSEGARLRQASLLPISASEAPAITPDGRYVAFYSTATNLVSGATNSSEIYIRDLVNGTTTWVSEGARAAAQAAQLGTNVVSYNHAISDDGQFVAFAVSPWPPSTTANRGLVLRYSQTSGLAEVVHTNATVHAGAPEDMRSLDMSTDGRFIAFVANTNGTTGRTTCILVWDAESGTTTLASGTLSNTVPTNSICQWPLLDPTGRFVAFLSSATNLTTNTLTGEYHLYVRDLQSGTTKLVDEDRNGFGAGISPATAPRLSADGRFVTYECADANLVEHDRNRSTDIFVRDLETTFSQLISARHPDLATVTPNALSTLSAFSASADGYRIAFSSEADNLVANDTNQFRDVFVRDLLAGTNLLVSVAADGHAPGNGLSSDPAISGDGRYVVFGSSAPNLVGNDTNNAQDVFIRDLQTGTTMLVSVNTEGISPGNQDSHTPTISADGRYVLFLSRATNLAPGTFSNENAFVRDLQSGVTHAVTTSGARVPVMTPDGSFVAFGGQSGSVFVWDSQTATRVHTNSATGLSSLATSPTGKRLVYISTSGLSATDRLANTNWVITTGLFGSHPGLRFSSDERILAYTTTAAKASADTNGTYDIYLYDFQTGDHLLVSHSADGTAALGGASDWPDISADGRFVSYRSSATNLVPNDINGLPDIFLYDRQTRINTLLSQSRSGNSSADARSLAPVFSGNGRVLLFQSWASDLVAQDFNSSSDLFAFGLLYATIVPGNTTSEGSTISWPAFPGQTYRVQYKDNLDDPTWQDVTGTVTIVGNTGFLTDLAPAAGQRFYRVVTE